MTKDSVEAVTRIAKSIYFLASNYKNRPSLTLPVLLPKSAKFEFCFVHHFSRLNLNVTLECLGDTY